MRHTRRLIEQSHDLLCSSRSLLSRTGRLVEESRATIVRSRQAIAGGRGGKWPMDRSPPATVGKSHIGR